MYIFNFNDMISLRPSLYNKRLLYTSSSFLNDVQSFIWGGGVGAPCQAFARKLHMLKEQKSHTLIQLVKVSPALKSIIP